MEGQRSTQMIQHSDYNETARLNALQQYLLESDEGQEKFKDLTQIAANVFQTKFAYITLLNKDQLIFISSAYPVLTGIERKSSFCDTTIQSNEVYEVIDTHQHDTFKHNTYVVGEPYVRYYCGAPLIDENGYKLGTLCVVDTEPRNISENQKNTLALLAKQVMNDFRINRREKELERQHTELEGIIRQRTASLIDTNHWLNQIIDLVPHPIFLKDAAGKYLLANIAQAKLFGKNAEELIGKADIDFVFNEDEYKIIQESDAQVVATQKTIILPEQIVTLKETKHYLYTSKVPLISPVDGELRILGVSIDLTEVRALKIEYDQSMEAYQKLVEISPDAIYIQSNDGKILFSNPAGIKLLGAKNLDELLGVSVMSFIHPDSIQEVNTRIGKSEYLNGVVSEQKAITLTGEILDIEVVSVSFIYDGAPAEQVIVRNVSEKIQAREALFQSREEFRTLTDNSTDIIARITKDSTFVYINKAISTITGKSLDFYSGKTPEQAGFPSKLCKGIDFIIHKTISYRKATSYYFENPQLEQMFRYAHVISVPEFNSAGEISSILCTVQDVTQLKRNEQQLIQTGKDLDRFVYSASHELRAPLKSILGLTRLISQDIKANNFGDMMEYISRIERSVLRLDETVKDVIEYSRNNRLSIERKPISFPKIIYQITENLSSLANFSKIEIESKIGESISFYSDSRRIQIVLNNIISNSIKYADLSKEKSFIHISIHSTQEECQIHIQDNGIGIDQKYLAHIFDMFFRATTTNEGDGLGLYIVKETLQKLEGSIEVESTLGEGTIFSIRLMNLQN